MIKGAGKVKRRSQRTKRRWVGHQQRLPEQRRAVKKKEWREKEKKGKKRKRKRKEYRLVVHRTGGGRPMGVWWMREEEKSEWVADLWKIRGWGRWGIE